MNIGPFVALAGALAMLSLSGCALFGDDVALEPTTSTSTSASPPASTTTVTASTITTQAASPSPAVARPAWLGSRTLPTDTDGFGIAAETPPELTDRRFATIDTLPPPPDDEFHATVQSLADVPEALARSTWAEGCPVDLDELAYLTVAFRGFDGRNHTGEIIVHADVADDIVSVFEALHEARFPIEEMRIVSAEDLTAPPTGDGNNTTGFVCRPVTGGTVFSEHAKGLAVDINPFHNPYVRGDRILPELAAVYTERAEARPGMITAGDVVVEAFDSIGWTWGGDWTSLVDYHHFSATGR